MRLRRISVGLQQVDLLVRLLDPNVIVARFTFSLQSSTIHFILQTSAASISDCIAH